MLIKLFPNSAELEPDEIYRINRARLAINLHKLPSEIDTMTIDDFDDLLSVMVADNAKRG